MSNATTLVTFLAVTVMVWITVGNARGYESTPRAATVSLLEADAVGFQAGLPGLGELVDSGKVKVAASADGSVFLYASSEGAAGLEANGVDVSVLLDDVAGWELYLVPVMGGKGIESLRGDHRVVAVTESHCLVAADPRFSLEVHLLPFKKRLPEASDAGLPLDRGGLLQARGAGAPLTYDPLIQEIVDSVSQGRLYTTLSGLTGENTVTIGGEPYTIHTRYSPTEGCRKAGQLILETFEAMGMDVEYDYFNFRTQLRAVVFPADNQSGWAVGRQMMVLHTQDGGEVWYEQHTGDEGALNDIVMLDTARGCIVGNNGIVLVTGDGETWQRVYPPTSTDLNSLCFVDDSTAYCCGDGGTILRSTDAGFSWSSLTSGTGQDLFGICFADPLTGWVVGGNGTLRKTENGGSGWNPVSSPVGVDLTDVACTDANTAWACGLSGTVAGTADGGTWLELTTPTAENLKSIFFINSRKGWACGKAGTVMKTLDRGTTWNDLGYFGNLNLECVHFISGSEGWAVGLATVGHTSTGGLEWEDQRNGVRSGDVNVVATVLGATDPEEIYIICGHYDSISEMAETYAPGADDNGTGTVGVIEAARVLRNYDFEATLRFVCFSREEQGLVGSGAYVREAHQRGDSIVAALNFDMIGYVDAVPEELDVLYDDISGWLADEYETAASLYVPDLDIVKTYATHVGSDNSSFWDYGYPSFCGIEDAPPNNPYYHRTTDRISTLDFDFYTDTVRAAVASLARLARVDTVTSSVAGVFEPATFRVNPNPGRGEFAVEMRPIHGPTDAFPVYDIEGRLVTTLKPALGGGSLRATWDGDDAAGNPVAPGIYFIKAAGRPEGAKVVLLR